MIKCWIRLDLQTQIFDSAFGNWITLVADGTHTTIIFSEYRRNRLGGMVFDSHKNIPYMHAFPWILDWRCTHVSYLTLFKHIFIEVYRSHWPKALMILKYSLKFRMKTEYCLNLGNDSRTKNFKIFIENIEKILTIITGKYNYILPTIFLSYDIKFVWKF